MAAWRGRVQDSDVVWIIATARPKEYPGVGCEQVLQTLAGFEECAAAGTVLVLELVGTFVFALTLETLIGRRASGLFMECSPFFCSP
jgi:hypothetical protein